MSNDKGLPPTGVGASPVDATVKAGTVADAGGAVETALAEVPHPVTSAVQTRREASPEKVGKDPSTTAKDDVVFVHSPSPDGSSYRVIRKRDEVLEIGELRSVEHGRPIHGEVVRLRPRSGGHDRLFDVEVIMPAPKGPGGSHAGPAQVATEAYRANWDAIFGPAEKAPN